MSSTTEMTTSFSVTVVGTVPMITEVHGDASGILNFRRQSGGTVSRRSGGIATWSTVGTIAATGIRDSATTATIGTVVTTAADRIIAAGRMTAMAGMTAGVVMIIAGRIVVATSTVVDADPCSDLQSSTREPVRAPFFLSGMGMLTIRT